eukprot:TRINITY_DN60376_c0_g1_i1.p1 TRINITY_DN60376_c0_g1~~TRINITY_DN60376_c0_g1_i1.p1  ORF type:complete len:310 (+),score=54.34 TRINITY_DN60376_c0_g1_i1:86-931(+)
MAPLERTGHHCAFFEPPGSTHSNALSAEVRTALQRAVNGEPQALRWVSLVAGHNGWHEHKRFVVRHPPRPGDSPPPRRRSPIRCSPAASPARVLHPPQPADGSVPRTRRGTRLAALNIDIIGIVVSFLDVWGLARVRACCRPLRQAFAPAVSQRALPCVAQLRSAVHLTPAPYCALACVWGRTTRSRRYVIVRQHADSRTFPLLRACYNSAVPHLVRRIRAELQQADPGCVVSEVSIPPGTEAAAAAERICRKASEGSPLEGIWGWLRDDGPAVADVLPLC